MNRPVSTRRLGSRLPGGSIAIGGYIASSTWQDPHCEFHIAESTIQTFQRSLPRQDSHYRHTSIRIH